MRAMPDASVDAIVTDPPYELGFMGRAWDKAGTAHAVAVWAEALRVAKPGAHLCAFGGTRTFHRLACAIEDAGWEIRDCLSWLYGQGFPKSHDIGKALDKMAGAEREVVGKHPSPCGNTSAAVTLSGGPFQESPNLTAPATPEAKQWDGWGTALKPAWEPIILARKPLTGTVAANVLAHGTGALNIDGCRVAGDEDGSRNRPPSALGSANSYAQDKWTREAVVARRNTTGKGRWPANVVLDEAAAEMLDEQSGVTISTGGQKSLGAFRNGDVYGKGKDIREKGDPGFGDSGGASRFFYTAKASPAERNAGLDGFSSTVTDDGRKKSIDNPYQRGETTRRNHHPTVKPLDLMVWLCTLVTPPGGVILDPFMGSGTTGIAALRIGARFIGCEQDAEYIAIARSRITGDAPLFNEVNI